MQWCEVPCSIRHRLSEKSDYSMLDLMRQIEKAFQWFGKVASAVTDANGPDLAKKTKLISELEIEVISKVFAVPKKDEHKDWAVQAKELSHECAKAIATKILKMMPDTRNLGPLPVAVPEGELLLHTVQKYYKDAAFAQKVLTPQPP